ncbi:hypothetical protein AB5I41_12030 [Sphingomonas sp. MMS24-JH45]
MAIALVLLVERWVATRRAGMSADGLARWARPARVRAAGVTLALGLPLAVAVAPFSLPAALLTMLAVAALAGWCARRLGQDWLVRRLDARRGDLEDSAGLLFADPAALGLLARLQQARVSARIDAAAVDLADPWPWRAIALGWALAAAIVAAALLWLQPEALAPSDEGVARTPGVPALTGSGCGSCRRPIPACRRAT